ncbi:MAG: VOC family protein [Chloroflexia bacterium]|nr:VOC family protein [Chloroflexia bacterium]
MAPPSPTPPAAHCRGAGQSIRPAPLHRLAHLARSPLSRRDGQEFIALNGGPHFSFTEAVSFLIACASQDEVATLWEKLSAGGETGQCGWLKDKFGLSWQVVPTVLGEMLQDPDRAKANRVLQAMMPMTKIDIAKLKLAYEGG